MAKENESAASPETIEIDLRNPTLAAFLAWLWPGAGHLYQRRYAKGILFMVCILGTFFFGLVLGEGRVVYAQFSKQDFRWQYGCQVLVGAPALPALAPKLTGRPLFGNFMAPPKDVQQDKHDELAIWHEDLDFRFEIGTLFTVVAGLLNVLAIYDAYAGPALAAPDNEGGKPPPKDKQKRKKKSAN